MIISLTLSICISTGNITTCEAMPLASVKSMETCLKAMDRVERDVRASPFALFEWELSCSKETTNESNSND